MSFSEKVIRVLNLKTKLSLEIPLSRVKVVKNKVVVLSLQEYIADKLSCDVVQVLIAEGDNFFTANGVTPGDDISNADEVSTDEKNDDGVIVANDSLASTNVPSSPVISVSSPNMKRRRIDGTERPNRDGSRLFNPEDPPESSRSPSPRSRQASPKELNKVKPNSRQASPNLDPRPNSRQASPLSSSRGSLLNTYLDLPHDAFYSGNMIDLKELGLSQTVSDTDAAANDNAAIDDVNNGKRRSQLIFAIAEPVPKRRVVVSRIQDFDAFEKPLLGDVELRYWSYAAQRRQDLHGANATYFRLIKTLVANKTVVTLSLSLTNLTVEQTKKLSQTLRYNKTITSLSLCDKGVVENNTVVTTIPGGMTAVPGGFSSVTGGISAATGNAFTTRGGTTMLESAVSGFRPGTTMVSSKTGRVISSMSSGSPAGERIVIQHPNSFGAPFSPHGSHYPPNAMVFPRYPTMPNNMYGDTGNFHGNMNQMGNNFYGNQYGMSNHGGPTSKFTPPVSTPKMKSDVFRELISFIPHTHILRELYISDLTTAEEVKSLAHALWNNAINTQSIQLLHVSDSKIWDGGVMYLANSIKRCHSLHTLCLSNCSFGDLGSQYLAPALQKLQPKSLRVLDLQNNYIGAKGARCIVDALKAPFSASSKDDALRDTLFSKEAQRKSAQSLLESAEKYNLLDGPAVLFEELEETDKGSQTNGTRAVVDGKSDSGENSNTKAGDNQKSNGNANEKSIEIPSDNNPGLTHLDVSGNCLGDEGVGVFAELLMQGDEEVGFNVTLKAIDLSDNPMDRTVDSMSRYTSRLDKTQDHLISEDGVISVEAMERHFQGLKTIIDTVLHRNTTLEEVRLGHRTDPVTIEGERLMEYRAEASKFKTSSGASQQCVFMEL